MILHNILKGFINTGLDDYIIKSLTHEQNKTVELVFVQPKQKKSYYRQQQKNIKTTPDKSNHNSKLDEEILPGVSLKQLIGPRLNDHHLSQKDGKTPYMPFFHKLYTQKLLNKHTYTGQHITYIDFTHFPQRLYERGYAIAKGFKKGKDQIVAKYIHEALFHPSVIIKGSSKTTPQGSTVYMTKKCCVVMLNLPDNKGVLKSVYPTNKKYRTAITHGWDGTVPINQFLKNLRSDN